MTGFKLLDNPTPVPVISDSAHNEGIVAKLRRVICKIRRGAAEFLPGGEYIPEDFT